MDAEHSTPQEADLTIGELFPAEDVVGQWMFSVSAIADDLGILLIEQKEAAASGDLRRMLFVQRVLATRLYEARRIVLAVDTRPEVSAFLSDKKLEPLDRLREFYLPAGSSPVDELYAVLRHNSVHYMWPGGEEISGALRQASHLPARTRIDQVAGRIDLQWVQVVAGMQAFGESTEGQWTLRLEERAKLGGAIQQAWLMLYAVLIVVYVRDRDIPMRRFVVIASQEEKPAS
jgi:hypothetical protein